MYRAIAEKISGLRVLAGGKWLTCIGNRPVKIGDRIWTDGRCVYGNDIESETPYVITPQGKEPELGIPIAIAMKHVIDCYTSYKGKIKHLDIKPIGKERGKNAIYIDEDKIFVNNNKTARIMFRSERDGVFAANCDNTGNVYKIVARLTNSKARVYKSPIDGDTYEYIPDIYITKNDKRILDISKNRVLTHGWSFIKNEENWAFIGIYNEGEDSDVQYGEGLGNLIRTEKQLGMGYLFTPEINGKVIFAAGGKGEREFQNNSFMDITRRDYNVSGLIGLRLPVHDNCTMVIDEVVPTPSYKLVNPEVAKITLYSPKDKKIFSDYILLGSNVTAYECSSKRYLVSIDTHYFSSIIFLKSKFVEDNDLVAVDYRTVGLDCKMGRYPKFLSTGIYTFENGELIESWLPEKEIDFPLPAWAKRDIDIEGVNPYIRLINQKLQPIKSYKRWHEKIEQPEQD